MHQTSACKKPPLRQTEFSDASDRNTFTTLLQKQSNEIETIALDG